MGGRHLANIPPAATLRPMRVWYYAHGLPLEKKRPLKYG